MTLAMISRTEVKRSADSVYLICKQPAYMDALINLERAVRRNDNIVGSPLWNAYEDAYDAMHETCERLYAEIGL